MKPTFIDLHCDTLLTLRLEGCGLDTAPGHIDLDKLCTGGALLQCLAVFIPDHEDAEQYHITETPWEFFWSQHALYEREMARFPDRIRPVRSMEELRRNREAGVPSVLLTVEDGACVEGSMDRLYDLYDAGVRLITLTWNYPNCFGFPNSPDPEKHRKGLTAFGHEAVAEMNRLGIAVDVSHLSEGGFWDVARESKKPFLASHSCARALCDHSRNLTDEQLRALGDAGGICGVNFYSRFLKPGGEHTENADILRHMAHIADKAGLETVALGSDFDGFDCTLEMKDYSGLAGLAEQIADRFGADAADRICRDNALRFFTDTMK